jgi:hypothetical protein
VTGEQFRDPGPVEVVQFGRETAEAAPVPDRLDIPSMPCAANLGPGTGVDADQRRSPSKRHAAFAK